MRLIAINFCTALIYIYIYIYIYINKTALPFYVKVMKELKVAFDFVSGKEDV